MKDQYSGLNGLREPSSTNPMINVAISELDENEELIDDVCNEYSNMIKQNYQQKRTSTKMNNQKWHSNMSLS